MNDYDERDVVLEIEEQQDEIELDVDNVSPIGGDIDYKKQVKGKPTINGTELYDNYNEIDPTVPGWSKEPTKPSYGYEDTGAVGGENQIEFNEIDRLFATVFGS